MVFIHQEPFRAKERYKKNIGLEIYIVFIFTIVVLKLQFSSIRDVARCVNHNNALFLQELKEPISISLPFFSPWFSLVPLLKLFPRS